MWSSQAEGGLPDPQEVFQPWAPQGPPAQTLVWIASLVRLVSPHFARSPILGAFSSCWIRRTLPVHQFLFRQERLLSVIQCQMRLQISQLKNIGSIFELSGVTFRLDPP